MPVPGSLPGYLVPGPGIGTRGTGIFVVVITGCYLVPGYRTRYRYDGPQGTDGFYFDDKKAKFLKISITSYTNLRIADAYDMYYYSTISEYIIAAHSILFDYYIFFIFYYCCFRTTLAKDNLRNNNDDNNSNLEWRLQEKNRKALPREN